MTEAWVPSTLSQRCVVIHCSSDSVAGNDKKQGLRSRLASRQRSYSIQGNSVNVRVLQNTEFSSALVEKGVHFPLSTFQEAFGRDQDSCWNGREAGVNV